MSLSTSRFPDYQPEEVGRGGQLWRRLTTYTPPPPVHRLIIEHQHPRRVWPVVSIVGNSIALLSGLSVGAAILCTGVIAAMVMDRHPELLRVAALHLSAQVDAFETAHGYGCVTWSIVDEHGAVHTGHGGPDCPPLRQEPPATRSDEGDAP